MRSLTAAVLVWMVAAPIQQAQQSAPETTRGSARFGTTTQLIVEDVIVKSKDGKPVEGLKASDFTITEDGKPQKITVFEYQTLEQEAAPAPVAPTTVADKAPEPAQAAVTP